MYLKCTFKVIIIIDINTTFLCTQCSRNPAKTVQSRMKGEGIKALLRRFFNWSGNWWGKVRPPHCGTAVEEKGLYCGALLLRRLIAAAAKKRDEPLLLRHSSSTRNEPLLRGMNLFYCGIPLLRGMNLFYCGSRSRRRWPQFERFYTVPNESSISLGGAKNFTHALTQLFTCYTVKPK